MFKNHLYMIVYIILLLLLSYVRGLYFWQAELVIEGKLNRNQRKRSRLMTAKLFNVWDEYEEIHAAQARWLRQEAISSATHLPATGRLICFFSENKVL